MTLFPTEGTNQEDLERELKRPLKGDLSHGEVALVYALQGLRFDEVRRLLVQGSGIEPDCRALIERQLQGATRQGELKTWSVTLPRALYDEYAEIARASVTTINACLAAAIERDSARRRQALDMAGGLEQAVHSYNRGTSVLIGEVRDLVVRVGSIQDLAMRITRLEKALQGGRAGMP